MSCLAEDYRPRVAFLANDFECLFLPLRDGIHEDIASSFAPFFDFAGQVRNAHDEAKLLVHCEVGVSRSATLATALVMSSEGKSLFDAFSEVRCKRPEVLVNIGFASQLQRLEHTLSPGLRDDSQLSSLARYLKQVCSVPAEAELLQEMLARHDYDAPRALRSLFDNEIPRVVQGVRL